MLACAAGVSLRLQACVIEELRDGQWRYLHTEHAVALRGQPMQVQRLAAQRHQYTGMRWQLQCRPMLLQQRHHLVLMEAGLTVLPTLQPEICIHDVVLLPCIDE